MCERDERWAMRLGWCVRPDGIRVQQTHYTALSAWLSCVKDEIYIRAMEDVTEISGPSLVIRTQTQTLSIIQFTCEKCEIESADPPTKFKQLGWVGWRERGEKQIFYNNPENMLQKHWSLGAAWKSEIWDYCSQASHEKGFVGRGWNVKWYVRSEAANWWHPQCLSIRGSEDNRVTAQTFGGN